MLEILGKIFIEYWGWVPLALVFGLLAWHNRRKISWARSLGYDLLEIIPNQDSDAKPSQFFEDLHQLTRSKKDLIRYGVFQERISLEVCKTADKTHYYVWMPRHVKEFVSYLLAQHYPGLRLQTTSQDYSKKRKVQGVALGINISTADTHLLPLQQAYNDPSVLEQIEQTLQLEENEEIWIQTIVEPVGNNWKEQALRVAKAARRGVRIPKGKPLDSAIGMLKSMVSSGTGTQQQELSKLELAIRSKVARPGFKSTIRVVYRGPQEHRAHARLQRTFKLLSNANGENSLTINKTNQKAPALDSYRRRVLAEKSMLLNAGELAFLWHFPHKAIVETELVADNSPKLSFVTDEKSAIGRIRSGEDEPQLFTVSSEHRSRHTIIASANSQQNTELVKKLIALDDNISIPAISVNYGSTYTRLFTEKYSPEILDLGSNPDQPYPLNPLIIANTAQRGAASHILTQLIKPFGYEYWTDDTAKHLQATIRLLMELPKPSLLRAEELLNDVSLFEQSLQSLSGTDPDTHTYWVEASGSQDNSKRDHLKDQTLRIIDALLADKTLTNSLCSDTNELNIHRIVSSGRQVQVQGTGLYGEFIAGLSSLQLMLFANDTSYNTSIRVYVDGAGEQVHLVHSLLTQAIAKKGVQMAVTTQNPNELAHFIGHEAFGSVGTLFATAQLARESRRLLEQPRMFGKEYNGPLMQHIPAEAYRLRLTNSNSISRFTLKEVIPLRETIATATRPTPVTPAPVTVVEQQIPSFAASSRVVESPATMPIRQEIPPIVNYSKSSNNSVYIHPNTFYEGLCADGLELVFLRG